MIIAVVVVLRQQCSKNVNYNKNLFFLQRFFNFYPYSETAQKIKFSIKDFFSKCDQICRIL